MADRTAAAIFGDVFDVLAARENKEEATAIAHAIWPFMRDYDFAEEQMDADKALVALGLARKSRAGMRYGPAIRPSKTEQARESAEERS